MSFIPQYFIDELLSRADIVSVIEKFVPLRKSGNNYIACCPFHQEKTASFTVSPTKQIYHCFGCGVGGNAISFLMQYEHLNFIDALKELTNQFGMEVPEQSSVTIKSSKEQSFYDLMEEITKFYQLNLRKHQKALDYLKKRGLSDEIIQKFCIGYAEPGWSNVLDRFTKDQDRQRLLSLGMLIKESKGSLYDRFRDRIVFPIRDRRGRVIAFGGRVLNDEKPKYLNSPETPIFHKGNELYGLYEARNSNNQLKRLLIVEGYMDVIALFQYGIDYAVATLGTATTSYHIEKLSRIASEIIFCFDGDQAGQTAAWRALEEILSVIKDDWQIKFVFLPEKDDPDSLIRKEGKELFEKRIDKAYPLNEFFFKHLKEKIDPRRIDSRAKFANLALSYIKKVPVNITRDILLQTLSNEIHIDIGRLNRYLQSEQDEITTQIVTSNRVPSLVRMAIVLLIQNPYLVKSMDSTFPQLIVPGMELFKQIVSILKQNPALSTGNLIEYFREDPILDQIISLANEPVTVKEQGLEMEFRDILNKFHEREIEEMIEHLMNKASFEGLTDEEKQELQKLIRQRQK